MPSTEQLEALLQRQPDDVFLNFGLAMELAKSGRSDEALARFDHVIGLDADYHAAYYHKGNLLLGLGQADAARDVLQRGVAAARRASDGHAESEMRDLLASAGG